MKEKRETGRRIRAMAHRSLALVSPLVIALATMVAAQAPSTQPAAKPDSPEIRRRVDTIRKSAGAQWSETVDFVCDANQSRANRPDDPEIEPTRVFDNLAVVGRTTTVVWIVTTSAGLVLLDAGYGDQVESVLLPGMKKLALDPAKVTHVIVGHGHADHFGGASYFQQRGARVALGGPDWDALESAASAGRGAALAPIPPPQRDIVITDGQTLNVGDTTFTFAMIPGHTPGSVGVTFPVKDGGTTRMAALYGGSILTPGRISDEGLRQYISSVEHWAAATRRAGVDVEIQNHPMYDGFPTKLQRLKQRKPGEPNPFVVGRDGYQRFVAVMSGCSQVQLARRAGG
jgi:metallo-beta-lactamase class B